MCLCVLVGGLSEKITKVEVANENVTKHRNNYSARTRTKTTSGVEKKNYIGINSTFIYD